MEGGTAPATLIFFIYRELEGGGRSVRDLGTKPNDIADLKYIGAFLSIGIIGLRRKNNTFAKKNGSQERFVLNFSYLCLVADATDIL